MSPHSPRLALAAALSGALLISPSAGAAPAAVSRTTATVVTHRVDIDGDGRADTVTLRLVSSRERNGYRLAVRTATGRSSSQVVYADSFPGAPASDLWVGVTGIDGVRGNEIMLDQNAGIGDFPLLLTYTWRKGKLTLLPAPGGSTRFPGWSLVFPPFRVSGYSFSMKGSTRYVVHHALNPSPSGRTYSGTNTTYRWTAKGWQRVTTKKSGVVSRATADKMADLRGLIWR